MVVKEPMDGFHSTYFRRAWTYRECNTISTWAKLSVDIYSNTNNYKDTNSRHTFVTSVSRVFETMRLRIKYGADIINFDTDETIALMAELLSCMADALRWSLVHSVPDCGAYTALPWVKDIAQCYQAARHSGWRQYADPPAAIPLTGNPALQPTFLLMLRLLRACIDRNLITHATAASDDETTSGNSDIPPLEDRETPASELNRLLELLENPELPDLPADLTLRALEGQQRVEPCGLNDPEVSPVADL